MKKLSSLTVIATFLATLIGFGLVALSTYTLSEQLLNHHLQNEKAHAMVIAKQVIVLPLWNYDEVYIQEVLNSFIDEKLDTVVAVKVVTADKLHHYQATSKKYLDKSLLELVALKDIDLLTDTISYGDRNLGIIEVYYSTAQFSTALKNLGGIIFIITIAMGLAVASGMIYVLRRWLTSPLMEIAKDARKVGRGDYTVKFKTNYAGELNIVTNSFNETLLAIQARDHQLHKQNSQLEELVDKRTNERDQEQVKSFQASRLASLGEMAATIAHEINNPLTIIQGHSTLLKSSLQKMNLPELVKKVEKIHETSKRIAKIVRGLKAFSRDGSEDKANFYKIETFVEDLTDFCFYRAKSKEIALKFNFTEDDIIYANTNQLGQVLINLINNSVDAVEHLDEKWILINFLDEENATRITITDSGFGINEKIIDKLMTPFFTTKEQGKGTGLGLSISHEMIARCGGQLFYNRDSKNTQFVIIIPKSTQEPKQSA